MQQRCHLAPDSRGFHTETHGRQLEHANARRTLRCVVDGEHAHAIDIDYAGHSTSRQRRIDQPLPAYSTITLSVAPRPNVSGMYISSAFGGGTTKWPGVVARVT